MTLNYTLNVESRRLDVNNGTEQLRYMEQYLNKRNIHIKRCPTSPCRYPGMLYYNYTSILLPNYFLLNGSIYLSGFIQSVTFTASPIPSKTSTTDVINIDTSVVMLLVVSVALCSTFMALLSKQKSKMNAFIVWLENIWINFGILFSESSARLTSRSSTRMVFSTWLLTALIITIEVGSYLKSNFAVTTYDLVDRYQDALKYESVYFGINFFSPAQSIRCSRKEEEQKRYWKSCKKLSISRYIDGVLWISERKRDQPGRIKVLLATLTELKGYVRKELKEIRQRHQLFYLGQSPVDTYVYFVVFHGLRPDQFLKEQVLKSALVQMETKALEYLEFEGNWMLDSVLWKKPTEEGTVLYLDDSIVIFKLWLIGLSISCLILLSEASLHISIRWIDGNKKFKF